MGTEGIRNTTEELAGKAKEAVGDLIDNDSLVAQGHVEEDAAANEAQLDDLKD